MEMLVSLSHEIRVDRQDSADAQAQELAPTDGQQRARELQEQKRIADEYGIDTPKDEIEEKEKDRIEREEDAAAERKITKPADLGQRKPIEDKELTATDIQNQHDSLTKI